MPALSPPMTPLPAPSLWRRQLIPAPGEPGYETWGDVPYELRQQVGSWTPSSYDPELKLIIFGTSVTSPAPKIFLDGIDKKYLYHNSTLALEVDTGEIRWYYQHLNDHWDMDHPFERLLVDTAVTPDPDEVEWINPDLKAGEVRKVITGISRQDRRGVHAGPGDRRVPVGNAYRIPEHNTEH